MRIEERYMEYMTVNEASQKWGVSARRVQILCAQGRVKGAMRFGPVWKIPQSAILPNARRGDEPLPMPRKSPFLDMTDLYNKPGGARECAEMLINHPEAHALFEAQIAYRRGEIERVYDRARYFLSAHSGFYAIIGGSMLIAFCALWRGDIELWREAKKHLFEAPCDTEEKRDILSLSIAIIDSCVYYNSDFPEWFETGNFEILPPDSHPAAKVYYAKLLYMAAFGVATKQLEFQGVQGLSLMRILPYTIEPMLSQAVVDQTVIPEICLRLSCAVAYYNSGNKDKAIAYIDKAVALALADRLYGTLAEHIRHFDGLLEERIAATDAYAAVEVMKLYERYIAGRSALSREIESKSIATNLTRRERECAKLAAFGFNLNEIGKMLHISPSSVQQALQRVYSKARISGKDELPHIL